MTPYYEDTRAGVVIYHGDWREVREALALSSVDHTITDPPYDARTHARARSLRGGGSDIPIDFAPLQDFAHVGELLDITRRWCLAFCALEQLGPYQQTAGPDCWVRAGIWNRTDGTPQISGDRPAQAAEGIAIMHGPLVKKRWRRGGHRGIWSCGVVREENRHPTQKPLALIAQLVEAFTDPGEMVFDPYAGSGTTARACKDLGRRCICIEKQEHYCEMAARRMGQEVLDLETGTSGAKKSA